jgi:hypothetical protein
VQEYATELVRLWLDHDHLISHAGYSDPTCKVLEFCMQDRTIGFLQDLARLYDKMSLVDIFRPS